MSKTRPEVVAIAMAFVEGVVMADATEEAAGGELSGRHVGWDMSGGEEECLRGVFGGDFFSSCSMDAITSWISR